MNEHQTELEPNEDEIAQANTHGACQAISFLLEMCHATAVSKGWWEQTPERSFGEQIALMHSELSEALEDYRTFGLRQTEAHPDLSHIAMQPGYLFYESPEGEPYAESTAIVEGPTADGVEVLLKPLGIASEFADVLIRIFDTCGRYDIPLAQALEEKMAYNRTRPYRHGGKLA